MSLPDHYLITVALHAVVLSAAVFLAVFFIRKPQRVALTALCGTLAIALLPWISAMRPRVSESAGVSGQTHISPVASLPEWTVVVIPDGKATVTELPTAPDSFTMPDAVTLAEAVWAIGSAAALAALLIACARILRWKRSLEAPDNEAWQAIREADQDLPRRHRFRISPTDGSPCVAGFLRPVVVIPSFLLDPAKHRELRWALRHELRHLRGSDSRWTMIMEWARVTQWWNPFVHLLISRWKMAREHVCDLAASDDDRATYGEFLIEMAAKPESRNPLAVAMVRRQRLKIMRARIAAVLRAAPGSAMPFEKNVLILACLSLLGAALMISCAKVGDPGSAPKVTDRGSEQVPVITSTGNSVEDDPEKSAKKGPVAQVKIQTRIIFADTANVQNRSIFTGAQMQHLMRMFAQKKGTNLATTPTVTTLTGETAMIEILHEHPDDPPWKIDYKNPQLRPNRFAGWSIRNASSYDGGKVRFRTDIGYGFIPGAHYSAHTQSPSMLEEDANINWSKLVLKNASGSAKLGPGETLAIDLGEVEPDRFGTVFITVTSIDSTGRHQPRYEDIFSVPEPQKE